MAVATQSLSAGGRIARASAILLAGFVASRLIGILREVVLSARFGTTADYDLYQAAFRLPDAIFTLVAGGALGSALIPVFAEYRAGRQEGRLSHLASAVFNLVALAAGLAAVGGIVFAPQLAPLLGAGFSPEQQLRLAALVRIMLLQPIFFGLAEVVTRYLNVHQHFFYPAIAPTLYNVAIILAALTLGPHLGTLGLAVGVVGGALAYFFVQVPAAVGQGFRWRPELDLQEPGLRQIAKLMLPRLVGQGAVQFSFIFTTRLATFLPEGSVSALYYSFQLMMLPLGMFAMSVANAAFPTLADQAARREEGSMAATVRRTLGTILFMMVPSALGLIVVGLPLVQTLFQRGRFTAESSATVALALAVYAAGLPAHGAIEILTRSFYALHNTRTPVVVAVAAMAANIVIATVLVGPLRHVGIALALSASTIAEAVALMVLLRRRLPALLLADAAAGPGQALAASAGKTLLAGAALAVAAVPTLAALRMGGIPPVGQLVGAAGAGATAFLAAAYALKSPDLDSMLAMVRSKLGR